jgi:uncharacterized protein (DUF697 family)/uncharacterized tellurite resistance protein B-like protein
MALNEQETLASLRILIAIAKADGVLHDDEKVSLMAALEEFELPAGTTVQDLLQEETALDKQLAIVTDRHTRENLYASAFAMAHTDGECAPEEQRLLNRVADSWEIGEKAKIRIEHMFGSRASEVEREYKAMQITDAKMREEQIRSDIRKTAIISSLLGAFFVPGLAIATDLAVVRMQIALAQDIGRYYGKELDRDAAKNLLRGFGVGTGVVIAASNLLKFLPGWGSAFGALAAFSTTQAVGHVIDHHFAGGGGQDADLALLKKRFDQAKKDAKQQYESEKDDIEAAQAKAKPELEKLQSQLEAGEIDQDEFEAAAGSLA